jgi:Ni/Fe-hydrogenase subunit HybB-like protein
MTYLAATLIFLYLPLIPDLALVRDRVAVRGGWRRRVYGLLALGWQGRPDQRRRLEVGVVIMSILIIPLAICVHSVLAWAFSMTSRPGWDSTIFAPYFVVAALYSGVALVVLVIAGFRRAYHLQPFLGVPHFVNLARIMALLGAVYLYFTFADLLTAGYVRTEGQVAYVAALLEGGFAPLFWLWFTAGLLTPIVLGGLLSFLPEGRRIPVGVTAAALVVVGMALKRLLIVVPSADMPLIGSTWGSSPLTWVPALITLGAVAAIPLLLMLFFRVIPILAVDEMAHSAIAPAALEPASTEPALRRAALEV